MARSGQTHPARVVWNVAKTVVALIGFWFIFLFVLPIGISIVEVELGIQRFPPLPIAAAVMLILGTILSLWAALSLAVAGGVTPLAFDSARHLVVSGPYAHVRHPLVTASIAQSVGIGIALGSVPVLANASAWLIGWYFFVRPREERDLRERFGKAWDQYARAVRAFRPRLTPYRGR